MIDGVEIKELNVFTDERGIFSEIIRGSDSFFRDSFAQLSYSMSFSGVAKAWHLHKKQTDWMCVLVGDVKLGLFDLREDSPSYRKLMEILMGETLGRKVVKIPPGIAHGYRIINGPMHIIYVTDKEYDPSDDLRIPHGDPEIGYDWTLSSEIK
ncbi:MAG: dTDP-4-dehydrorhamnose 3,5-epimerase family protein [Desulfobacteraceae bacterium]|nr:dTDP-4-dehydrorhamnose 3,5-epimerase family protein [Desulfobacteraceae bacterium]